MVSDDFFPTTDEIRQREQDRQNHLVYSALIDPDNNGRVCLQKAVVYPDQEPETETVIIADVGNNKTAQALVEKLTDLQQYVTEVTQSAQQGAAAMCLVGQTIGVEGYWLPWVRADQPLFQDNSLPRDMFSLPHDCPHVLIPPHSPDIETRMEAIQQCAGQEVSINSETDGGGSQYLAMIFEERFEEIVALNTLADGPEMSPDEEEFWENQQVSDELADHEDDFSADGAWDRMQQELLDEAGLHVELKRYGRIRSDEEIFAAARQLQIVAGQESIDPGFDEWLKLTQASAAVPTETEQISTVAEDKPQPVQSAAAATNEADLITDSVIVPDLTPEKPLYDVLASPESGCLYLAKSRSPGPDESEEFVFAPLEMLLIADMGSPALAETVVTDLRTIQENGNAENAGQGDQALCVICNTIATQTGMKSHDAPLFSASDLPPDPFPTNKFPEALCTDENCETIRTIAHRVGHADESTSFDEGHSREFQLVDAFQQTGLPLTLEMPLKPQAEPDPDIGF